jgi:hypothetical protein
MEVPGSISDTLNYPPTMMIEAMSSWRTSLRKMYPFRKLNSMTFYKLYWKLRETLVRRFMGLRGGRGGDNGQDKMKVS